MFKKLVIAAGATLALGAQAAPIVSAGANSFGSAQVLGASLFTLDNLATVTNSTTQAHVEIQHNGTTNSNGYFYYTFNVAGGTVNLDADSSGVDTELGLWDAATGALLATNDDNNYDNQSFIFDSAIRDFAVSAGSYVVGVCRFSCSFGANGVITGSGLNGANFVLNISADVPEPASFGLAGLALVGLAFASRKKRLA